MFTAQAASKQKAADFLEIPVEYIDEKIEAVEAVADKTLKAVSETEVLARVPQARIFNDERGLTVAKLDSTSGDEAQSMDERRFQEQCFLVDNLMELRPGHPANYENFSVVRGGDPHAFLTRSAAPSGVEVLHNAIPEELSSLVPEIKLWKVFYPSETSEGIERVLPFDNFLSKSSLRDIMSNRAGRGAGAGIKSLEWDLEGTNLFEADKLISARMVLVFQDMDALSKVVDTYVKDGVEFQTRYLDLFHANKKYDRNSEDGKSKICETKVWNEKHFRIKAKVGWSAPNGHKLADAVKKTGYTFFLSLVKHDISFNEDATIEVTLEYQALIESVMLDFRSDILQMSQNENLSYWEERKRCFVEEISEYNERTKGRRDKEAQELDAKEIEKTNEFLESMIRSSKYVQYRRFLTELMKKTPIYFVDTTQDQIGLWQAGWISGGKQQVTSEVVENRKRGFILGQGRATNERSEWNQTIADMDEAASTKDRTQVGQDRTNLEQALDTVTEWGKGHLRAFGVDLGSPVVKPKHNLTHRINYITLGSILDTALSVLGDNSKRLQEMRSIIGDIKYIDPRTNQPVNVSLADIPIALNLFQTWYYDECVAAGKRTWKLKSFIKSLVDKLFLAAISEKCFPCVGGFKKPRLNLVPLQIPLNSDGSCLITGKKGVKESNNSNAKKGYTLDRLLTKEERSGWTYDSKVGQYLFFHMGGEYSSLVKNRGRDAANGIHHLHVGSSRGLVKRITFNKEDSPHIAAYRITEGEASLGGLKEIYNATVDMVGNTFYKPGSYVYIDSSSPLFGSGDDGATIGTQIGLGGYYMVMKVNSMISSGEYVSRLDCRWQSDGIKRKRKPADKTEPCEIKRPPLNEVTSKYALYGIGGGKPDRQEFKSGGGKFGGAGAQYDFDGNIIPISKGGKK